MSITSWVKTIAIVAGSAVVATTAITPAKAATLNYNWFDYDTDTYGSFAFNNEIIDSNLDPALGIFSGGMINFTLTQGAFSRTVTQFTENLIQLTPTTALLTATGNTTGIPGGKFRFTMEMASNVLLSDSLVDFNPTASHWSSRKLTSEVFYADGSIAAKAVRQMDEIKSVPEPASIVALLLVGSLGGLISKRGSKLENC
jgi:hypothetical protein